MVKKRKKTYDTSTTGDRWTGIPDPRANMRFRLGDLVQWDEDDRVLYGIVEGFTADEHSIIVHL